MKKWTKVAMSLGLVGLLSLGACVQKEVGVHMARTGFAEDSTELSFKEKQIYEDEILALNPIDDLDLAFSTILNTCDGQFIGYHPIDENFLAWMYCKYGESAVEQVATSVQNEYQDSNIWYHITGKTIHVLWAEYCRDTGYDTVDLERTYWKDTASSDEIVMDFTGDVNLAEGMGNVIYMDQQANGIFDCLSEALVFEMQTADLTMVNNEFTYSTRGTALAGKPFTFRAKPERVNILDSLGVDIVGVANNHVWDYGEEALLDTLDTLEEDGMPYVGAGRNLKEAMTPSYFIMNGRKIAIVAATQIERSLNYTKEATDDMAGVLKTLDSSKFVSVIKEAKKNSDYVIVFVHWGTEGNSNYGSDQLALANDFVAAGADAIIGGHTHCLQGISYIQNVPVIYSLGNFWFSSTDSDGYSERYTGIAQVRIDQAGELTFRFLPCSQKEWKTHLAEDEEEKQLITAYMQSISSRISIDSEGYVTNLAE